MSRMKCVCVLVCVCGRVGAGRGDGGGVTLRKGDMMWIKNREQEK